jgi:CRP/FNR family transcriptional regulator, cyclic AMP receptor protein
MTAALDDLRRVPLFSGMTDRALAAVADLATERTFDDGTALTTEGEVGDAFYLVLDGALDITRGGSIVRRLGPGEFIGEISLVDGRPRTATATAAGPVRTLAIACDGFAALMERHPAVRLGIVMALTERVRSDERTDVA